MSFKLDNNFLEVSEAIDAAALAWLIEASSELEAQTKKNTKVDTSRTKNSWGYKIEGNESQIGSSYANAIYEEFGTGVHAIEGNGRKTKWKYQDAEGRWHTTSGKVAKRPFNNAYLSLKTILKERARIIFKEKMR